MLFTNDVPDRTGNLQRYGASSLDRRGPADAGSSPEAAPKATGAIRRIVQCGPGGIPTRAPVRVTLLERIVLGMLAAFVLGCCVLVTWSRLAEVLA